MGQARATQRGVSFIMVIFVVGVLAYIGLLGAQVFPTFLEYQSILKAAKKASEGNSVAEVRLIFDKAAAVDDIKTLTGKDIEVTKQNDRTVVSFAYTKEIHMFGPAYLLMKYSGQSK
jgi:hypothetical protein